MAGDVVFPVGRRATVAFTPRAATDLDWMAENLGLRQVDAVNRAVRVYAFIERELAQGKKLAFVGPDDSSVETVNII